MIKLEQVKFVPQWGSTLIERLKKAGYETIGTDDIASIAKIKQIGVVRLNNLYQYVKWYKKKGKYLVERNENYEIYVENGVVTVLFDIEVNGMLAYRTDSKIRKGTQVEGKLSVMYKSRKFEYDYEVLGQTVALKDNRGRYIPIPTWLQKTLRRTAEITRTRHGVKTTA